MRYLLNRAAICDAADTCCTSGRMTIATNNGLLTREHAERAFAEWSEQFGWSGVSMRLTSAADGCVAAEFSVDQAEAA